jgi:hypothetical protein
MPKCRGDMFTKKTCENEVRGWSYTWLDQLLEVLTLAPLFGQCRSEFDRYYYEVCLDCRVSNQMHASGYFNETCCDYCRKNLARQKEIWTTGSLFTTAGEIEK